MKYGMLFVFSLAVSFGGSLALAQESPTKEAPTAEAPKKDAEATDKPSKASDAVTTDKKAEELRLELVPAKQENYVHIQLEGRSDLTKLGCSFDDEPWQPMTEQESGNFRTKHPRSAFDKRSIRVQAFDPLSKKYVVLATKLSVAKGDVSLAKVSTKRTDAATPASKDSSRQVAGTAPSQPSGIGGYQGEFLSLVNSYRANRGLGSLSYDNSLESIAAINNQRGGGHRYTGGTAQVWAAGSATASGTLRQWQNSSGHNAILLGGGYSRIGIHYDGRGWTANLR
jgi:uncharacterized protein YkwD